MLPGVVFSQRKERVSRSSKPSRDSVFMAHPPQRATWMSAVVPGLGQAYNKKWWKIPIVYVSLGGCSYMVYSNQKQFARYKSAILARKDGQPDEFAGVLNEQALINEMDSYRKSRDLFIGAIILLYAVQIVDANVDAYLFTFNIDDNLTLRLAPVCSPLPEQACVGLSCSLKF